MIFDLFGMEDNYEERKVARFEEGDLTVDTVRVSDSDKPFETGIRHTNYNNGKWVVVETYNTQKQAEAGHEKWVKTMTSGKLPEKLLDVSMSDTAKLIDCFDKDGDWRVKEKG